MTSPSMLRQHSSFDSAVCEDGSQSTSKSPYPCYPGSYPYPRNCHENLVYVMPSDSSEPNGNGNEPVTKNAGSRWREDETEALVEIWRDKICQTRWWKQSKGVRVNKEMWEEIAHLLAEREVFRTPAQCQIRMKNLLQFYRQTIDSRRSEKSWEDLPEYFDIVDRIMTRKDAGGNPPGDNKSYSPSTSELSPPKIISNGEKNYEEEKENGKHPSLGISVEDRKISNKRKSLCTSDNYEGEPDLDHAQHYPPTPNSLNNCHGPIPRKVPSYIMKSDYGSNSHIVNPPLYPTFTRPPRSSEACSSSCCTKGPCAKKQCKEKDYKDISHNDQMPPPPIHLPPPEQYNILPPQMAGTIPSDSTHKEDSRNHTCNFYGIPPPHNYRPNYLQPYRGVPAMEGLKGIQPHLMFNQDLLQLQYKQMKTLIEIEKKRLEIEENRLKEEKEANNRTSAFLLEAVKILAETFRRDSNNNESCSTTDENPLN